MDTFKLSEELPYRAGRVQLFAGEKKTMSTGYPAIVFVTDTTLQIALDSSPEQKQIKKGQLFLLPPDTLCTLTSEIDSRILFLEIPDMAIMYIYYNTPLQWNETVKAELLFHPLSITDPVGTVAESICHYLDEEMDTHFLMGLKALELFHFLKHCFPEDELHRFFSPILSDDYRFMLFVLTHYRYVTSAKELCNLSHFSPAHFERQFRKVFGEPPYQWMLQKKIRDVYTEVKDTNKPLKLIADQYGFASISNFGDFCRKHFGKAPSVLRKKI